MKKQKTSMPFNNPKKSNNKTIFFSTKTIKNDQIGIEISKNRGFHQFMRTHQTDLIDLQSASFALLKGLKEAQVKTNFFALEIRNQYPLKFFVVVLN